MAPTQFAALLQQLQSTGFREISGTRLSATVPVSERLINEMIAATIPAGGHVRDVQVRPEAGDRFSVRITPRASILPALTVKLQIERQPELPGSPVLVLRMATMGGLFGLATAALPQMLPPGVRMEGDRIHVDLRSIAAQRGLADLLQFVKQLRVNTEEGRVIIQVDATT